MKPCEANGCETEIKWGRWCEMHRARVRRHGDPNVVIRMWKVSRAERIDAYTDKSGGPDACWPWTKTKNANGYGVISTHDGRTQIASRAAYEEANGVTMDQDVDVMHLCNNPPCCNPAHLRAGLRGENQAHMVQSGHSQFGAKNWNAKLTEDDVREIRRLRSDGVKLAVVAAMFGVADNTVSRIATRKRWAHLD